MTTEQIWNTIQTTGLATVLLVGLLFGLYKLARLVIEKAVIPMAMAHINFVNVATANMEKITKNLDTLNTEAICRYQHNNGTTSVHEH